MPSFYGWRIVAVAFVVDFVAVGFWFYSYGVFFKSIAAELEGGSRFGVSLGLTVSGTVGAVIAPWLGRALDHRSIKRFMLAGTLLVVSGFSLLSLVAVKWQFYLILATFFGFGMSSMGGLASSKLVANWFETRRGTALGVATVGVSLSGLAMPIVATWLVANLGWRGSFRVYALLTLLIVLPLVLRYVVNRPEDVGLRPDGDAPVEPVGPVPLERAWRTREIARDRNFWVIALSFGLAFSALSSILTHLVPYATDLGVASYRAAWILSVSAGAGAVGKMVFGWLADRVDPRIAVWISFGAQIAGLLLIMSGEGFAELLAAGAAFGFGMGGVVPLNGTVTGAAFGRLSFGKATGLLRPAQLPIHMAGAPMAGWIFDRTGSYDTAFQIFLGFYVAACLTVAALRVAPARSDESLAPSSSGETGLA